MYTLHVPRLHSLWTFNSVKLISMCFKAPYSGCVHYPNGTLGQLDQQWRRSKREASTLFLPKALPRQYKRLQQEFALFAQDAVGARLGVISVEWFSSGDSGTSPVYRHMDHFRASAVSVLALCCKAVDWLDWDSLKLAGGSVGLRLSSTW